MSDTKFLTRGSLVSPSLRAGSGDVWSSSSGYSARVLGIMGGERGRAEGLCGWDVGVLDLLGKSVIVHLHRPIRKIY